MIRRTCLLALAFVTGAMLDGHSARAEEFTVSQNVTYAEVGEVKLQLDLAVPNGKGPFPALVLIHGGGWSGGNRLSFRPKMEEAAKRGYVAATISYRLTEPDADSGKPKTPFPAQIHDCKAAVRWLRAHAEEFKINSNRIGVMGGSAGGHLSLLVGLTSPSDNLEGVAGNLNQSSRVQAVVNIFGPTDLIREYETAPGAVGFVKALCNGTPDDARLTYENASPIKYVSRDDPPVLTLHGDKDKLVPLEQAQILDERMKAVGAKHELLVLEDQGHGFTGEAAEKADQAEWDFLAKYLMPARN